MIPRSLLAVFLLALILGALPAYGYIDPGAGSLVLQLILGGVAGAFVTLKLFWNRIRGRRSKPAEPVE